MAHRIRVTHLLLAGGLVLAAQPALAQEGMLFKNLMEGVIGGRPGDDIEYRQRPPLVVPPNSTLPRPQAPASTRNAAWPNDPDVAARRAEAEASRVPVFNPNWRNNPMLSQEELRRGRTTRDAGRPVIAEDHNNYNNQIAPIRVGRELASRQNQTALDQLTYGSEPPRRTLAEPPVGYRRPVGSAPLGPGQGGPVEDRQAVGQREFLTGQIPMQ
ncbi:MAG TPA: hypothetical protein VGV17_09495 [Bosea sp. (in: a-proteobacteria)]|jgi:hypothetical protein|uniref:hypothetical protein n=1 Tax=unclassified Bosea (in: a-proteobacteria) TaxID=2653178 RepID=UPI00083D152A|nr:MULTISPECIES: hypothetical protein [unclassified Bosea (in: a-proteobacteria)]AOG03770.1 hypothetical protein BSY19_1483 [Bosea sp. RAC05]MBX9876418.1 hypothetical protein [Beijerinckiaceae bacterium]WRH57864.1 MAG: hypothetical protein RSE11_23320 [Bosea sp. (in: a-proteobacteria)]HEV2553980.1 hypothetical protein [Bosea sp. (in: a-proteobacteria)]